MDIKDINIPAIFSLITAYSCFLYFVLSQFLIVFIVFYTRGNSLSWESNNFYLFSCNYFCLLSVIFRTREISE